MKNILTDGAILTEEYKNTWKVIGSKLMILPLILFAIISMLCLMISFLLWTISLGHIIIYKKFANIFDRIVYKMDKIGGIQ